MIKQQEAVEEHAAVLKSMKSNKGHSVYDLSMNHSVLLVFIKFLGCPGL